jgi:hypothetical protein
MAPGKPIIMVVMLVVASTATDWISAVGAVIAAVGTAGTLIYSLRLLRDEERNRRGDELRRAKGIARRLTAKLEPGPVNAPALLTVHNSDPELHFYEVEVFALGREGTYVLKTWDVIAPGEDKIEPAALPQGTDLAAWTIDLTYRDDEGNWWRQVRDGTLTPMGGPPPKRTLTGTPLSSG